MFLIALAAAAGASAAEISPANCTHMKALIEANCSADYELAVDANCSADTDFAPICPYAGGGYTGVFDGGNHAITGLEFSSSTVRIGLFSYLDGASVSNLRLEGFNLTCGAQLCGMVAGQAANSGIDNISAEGRVSSNYHAAGGLFGWVTNSFVSSSSSGGSVNGTYDIGGLAGYIDGLSSVYDSYSWADVEATGNNVAGLVGLLLGSARSSYATGDVTGNDDVGGLVGELNAGLVSGCYATGSVFSNTAWVGGLIGSLSGGATVNGSYWLDCAGDDAATCYKDGDENCTKKENETWFYGYSNLPVSLWGFPPWSSVNEGLDHPTLAWSAETGYCSDIAPPENYACAGGNYTYAGDAFINVTASYSNCSVTAMDLTIGPGGHLVYDGCLVSVDNVWIEAGGRFDFRNSPSGA